MKTLLATLVAVALPTAAAAQTLLTCAADTHLTRKGDYLNGMTTEVDEGVWEWEIGSGLTYSNIQGITADGLLHATVATGDPAYALAVFDTANLLLGRYNADPTLRPYAQDADFLLDLCAFDPAGFGAAAPPAPLVEGNEAYCTLAATYYSRLIGQFPNPWDNVDRHITAGRGSLTGWDIGWHIRAAWRAGFLSYAQGMIDRVLARRPDWEHVLLGGFDYTESSYGALTRVLFEMWAAGDTGTATHDVAVELADSLLATQAPDGSWGEGDPQSTAYAVLGLHADLDAALLRQPAWLAGAGFLAAGATPEPTCGWSYPPEYGEQNSEAMMALATVAGMPFVDGFESGDVSAWSAAVGATPLRPVLGPAAVGTAPPATAFH